MLQDGTDVDKETWQRCVYCMDKIGPRNDRDGARRVAGVSLSFAAQAGSYRTAQLQGRGPKICFEQLRELEIVAVEADGLPRKVRSLASSGSVPGVTKAETDSASESDSHESVIDLIDDHENNMYWRTVTGVSIKFSHADHDNDGEIKGTKREGDDSGIFSDEEITRFESKAAGATPAKRNYPALQSPRSPSPITPRVSPGRRRNVPSPFLWSDDDNERPSSRRIWVDAENEDAFTGGDTTRDF